MQGTYVKKYKENRLILIITLLNPVCSKYYFNISLKNNKIFYIIFLYLIFNSWCEFYNHRITLFGLVTFQEFKSSICMVAIILDIIGLNYFDWLKTTMVTFLQLVIGMLDKA